MPCTKTMRTRNGDVVGSGCRKDCLHRAMVLNYREMKVLTDETRKIDRENVTGDFAVEGAEYDAVHPPLTFKQYLQQSREAARDLALDTPADYRYCAICGEWEGSVYQKHCCSPDNMIEA